MRMSERASSSSGPASRRRGHSTPSTLRLLGHGLSSPTASDAITSALASPGSSPSLSNCSREPSQLLRQGGAVSSPRWTARRARVQCYVRGRPSALNEPRICIRAVEPRGAARAGRCAGARVPICGRPGDLVDSTGGIPSAAPTVTDGWLTCRVNHRHARTGRRDAVEIAGYSVREPIDETSSRGVGPQRRAEALHEQVVPDRVDPADAEEVVDERARPRTASRDSHPARPDEVGHLRDGEEVGGVAEVGDDAQLVVEAGEHRMPGRVTDAREAGADRARQRS